MVEFKEGIFSVLHDSRFCLNQVPRSLGVCVGVVAATFTRLVHWLMIFCGFLILDLLGHSQIWETGMLGGIQCQAVALVIITTDSPWVTHPRPESSIVLPRLMITSLNDEST